MQKILAIAWLTWKAAIRFRLFLVLAALLLASVVALPLLLEDDGTPAGFAQILLTYTLTTITTLLGLSTLWLACGTLARDIEECQIQVVAVKPVARWQIWLGKWLGLVSLNAALLAISGAGVYTVLQWRADRLPPLEREKLRNEILVARGSARESSKEKFIQQETERLLKERLQAAHNADIDVAQVRAQIRLLVLAQMQVVGPGEVHGWSINLGPVKDRIRGQPLFLRVKFNAARDSEWNVSTFRALWQVGDPDKTRIWHSAPMSLAQDTFHEFAIPPDLVDADGNLTILFNNINNSALLFPLGDGMEVLYREGSFEANYVRALGIILCWMALLAALGLAAASFLSFPVAAFCSLTLLAMALFSNSIANVVADNSLLGFDPHAGGMRHTPLDSIFIPVFRVLVTVIGMAKNFSPIAALSLGRSITWLELFTAFTRIVLVLGGIIGGIGMLMFHRRELATAQGNQ